MLSGYSCRLRHFSISFRNCVTFIWLFQFLRWSIRQCWQRVQAIVNGSPCENDALMAFRIIPRYYGVTKTHFQSPKIIANSKKKNTYRYPSILARRWESPRVRTMDGWWVGSGPPPDCRRPRPPASCTKSSTCATDRGTCTGTPWCPSAAGNCCSSRPASSCNKTTNYVK